MSKKPGWVRDAVATTVGWVNPRTNEVLSVVRGLDDPLPFYKGKIIWPDKKQNDSVVDVKEPSTTIITNESELTTPEISETNKVEDLAPRKSIGRPRKIKPE